MSFFVQLYLFINYAALPETSAQRWREWGGTHADAVVDTQLSLEPCRVQPGEEVPAVPLPPLWGDRLLLLQLDESLFSALLQHALVAYVRGGWLVGLWPSLSLALADSLPVSPAPTGWAAPQRVGAWFMGGPPGDPFYLALAESLWSLPSPRRLQLHSVTALSQLADAFIVWELQTECVGVGCNSIILVFHI